MSVSWSGRSRIPVEILSTVFLAGVIWLIASQSAEPLAAQADAGGELYAAKCASCHQAFGQGVAGTFPPLAGNAAATDPDYVAEVIRNGRIGELEVDGVTYTTAMPAVLGVSDSDVESIVSFVVELAGREAPTSTPSTAAPTEPPSAATGEKIFTGASRLENGAVACSSCHVAGSVGNLGGSSLGPDITGVYEKLGGDVGLRAWLSNPPSATMTPLFADKPLTDAELGHLTAFLAEAPDADRAGGIDWLTLGGLGVTAVLLLGMAIAWRGMRQTYVSRLRSRA